VITSRRSTSTAAGHLAAVWELLLEHSTTTSAYQERPLPSRAVNRKARSGWTEAVPEGSLPHPTAPSGVLARRPLVLTGGPAVRKTTTARPLAEALPRAAFIDVDDLRLLIVAGHEAWGPQGDAQRALGAANACLLGQRFGVEGFDVAIADVVTPATADVYRHQLRGCLLVHLTVTLTEAHRRAATRPVWSRLVAPPARWDLDGAHRVPGHHRAPDQPIGWDWYRLALCELISLLSMRPSS